MRITGSVVRAVNNVVAHNRLRHADVEANATQDCLHVTTCDVGLECNILAANDADSIHSPPNFDEGQFGGYVHDLGPLSDHRLLDLGAASAWHATAGCR